ncbi:DUF4386 family protein [Maritimibacter sp. UBA3975]|uniref:DUF4386 family protein n=1 Tax=Maritimibacter sp. UBA3975 TaxID=1946833 RepID=UPI000C0ADF1E|nr:DUF4386 family protein [Maritimibacter sp. UBA3975]MAM62206.1 hypothetical protein [Maritimibacter sp.]|tara:strand:+ start:45922 stop:46578 length:657 start_codon:yes stop_codon:yes gene_type:complete
MTLSKTGGLAALLCAITYVIGFALLLTVFAPLNFGTANIDPAQVVRFIDDGGASILIAWNLTIYVVNALALAVLTVALARRLAASRPGFADVTRALGLIWATLVLGAGMIANVAVETAAHLFATDPDGAAQMWSVLRTVELGLGGGNEIAGGAWIATVSLAASKGALLPRSITVLGLIAGVAGLATVIAPIGDAVGAVFGLGAIVWFVLVGWALLRTS